MSCASKARSSDILRDPLFWLLGLAILALVLFSAIGGELGPALGVGGIAFAALVGVSLRLAESLHDNARATILIAALDGGAQARLICNADGTEVFRNQGAKILFGPEADPLSILRKRAKGDEQALDDSASYQSRTGFTRSWPY